MRTKPTFAILVLIAAILACNTPATLTPPPATAIPSTPIAKATATRAASPKTPATAQATTIPVTPPPNVRGEGFASYRQVAVALPKTYQGDALPVKLASVTNYRQFKIGPAQEKLLTQNGFVVAPAEWLEFFQVYEDTRYKELPVFVTTDSVYHIYHLLFDKMLRDLERENFAPDIAALTRACVASARDLYNQFKGTEMEKIARRVWAYFVVADNLISPGAVTPPEVADLERRLEDSLGTRVSLNRHSQGRGTVVIHFYSDEELDALIERLLS